MFNHVLRWGDEDGFNHGNFFIMKIEKVGRKMSIINFLQNLLLGKMQ